MGRCLLDDYQGICSRNSVKFGVNFRAYHKYSRGSDYLNASVFFSLSPERNMLMRAEIIETTGKEKSDV